MGADRRRGGQTLGVGQAEFLIAALLVAVAGLSALARRLGIPYPIVLVIGGALVGFVPGLPEVNLDPDVVLVVFLPPLLYSTAFFANLGDLRRNLRPISITSIGLVLRDDVRGRASSRTTLIPGMSWEVAFVLGAIVSPTDPLAGAMIMRRLDVPRRQVSIVEGEGLFNDATALVAFRVAVTAVVGGSFSLAEAGIDFVLAAIGGVLIGLAIGWVVAEIRKRTEDAQVSITISLLTGYAAFIPANAIGASGVLAAVTAGIYMGVRGPSIIPARTRLQGLFVWDILDFLINAVLFVLVGLELRAVVDSLGGYSVGDLAGYALATCGVVVVTRHRLGDDRALHHPRARSPREPACEAHHRRVAARDRVERHAGRGLAGRRAGDTAHHRLGRLVPQPRPDHLPHLLGDLLHPRRPGPHPAGADSRPRRHQRRQ